MVDIITMAMAKAAAGGSGDMHVTGNLQVDGNITQQGQSYETHAQKVYTKDDYIVTRDGAVSGLASGDFSGFQVKKYDGTNDGRLVVDSDGTARVGDVGDEQPLLTRAETADLVNGAPLVWDATNLKAVSGSAGGGGDWVNVTSLENVLSYDGDTTTWTVLKDLLVVPKSSSYTKYVTHVPIYFPKGYTVQDMYFTYYDMPVSSRDGTKFYNRVWVRTNVIPATMGYTTFCTASGVSIEIENGSIVLYDTSGTSTAAASNYIDGFYTRG